MSMKKHPKKQLTKQQQSDRDDYFSTFVALGIVLIIPVIIFLTSFVGGIINDVKYSSEIKKGDRIDTENDTVVLTYPAGIFKDDKAINDSVKTLKKSEGMKKVVKNKDGSVTALMNVERYEKIKDAAMYTAQSLPYISISETTAVRDISYNEEMTVFDISVLKDSETVDKECMNILSMVSLYHVCNMNPDAKITMNYIDSLTGEVYLSQTFDISGRVIS